MSVNDQIESLRDECDAHYNTIGRALRERNWQTVFVEAAYLQGACRELQILDTRKPIPSPAAPWLDSVECSRAEVLEG